MQGRDSSQLGQIPNFKCFFEALSLFLNNLSNCWTSMKKFIQQNWLFICQILRGQDKSLGYIVMDYDILHLSLLPCCSNTSSCKWRARWRRMRKAWVGWRRPRKLIIFDIFHFASKSGYFGYISVFLKVGLFWKYIILPQSWTILSIYHSTLKSEFNAPQSQSPPSNHGAGRCDRALNQPEKCPWTVAKLILLDNQTSK